MTSNDKNNTLQNLIKQLRTDLSAPVSKHEVPIFWVEQAEIEIQVDIEYKGHGKFLLSVLPFIPNLGVEGGGEVGKKHGHTVKITLQPIISREKMMEHLGEKNLLSKIVEQTEKELLKEGNVAGEPEF